MIAYELPASKTVGIRYWIRFYRQEMEIHDYLQSYYYFQNRKTPAY